jgi:hypothetical protein
MRRRLGGGIGHLLKCRRRTRGLRARGRSFLRAVEEPRAGDAAVGNGVDQKCCEIEIIECP